MVEGGPAEQPVQATQTFDFAAHTFKTPDKTLVTPAHVEEFKESQGCKELIGFITALVGACKTSKMTATPLTEVSKFSAS